MWKLNCDLLCNEEYIKLINQTIEHSKLESAIPIYNWNNIDDIEDKFIQFTISDKLFLEMLLLKLRQETIKIASQQQIKINNKETKLISEIQTLENDLSLIHLTDLLHDKKQELNEIQL